jgi:ABC-type Zn uptake system ZnuABC Zn-binding protein ZnuA
VRVVATATFLADIAQNVAGDRVRVGSILAPDVDPHAFQATPADVVKVSESQVLIVNGAGFEGFLDDVLRNAGGSRAVVEASAGLPARKAEAAPVGGDPHGDVDPHFWLAANNVARYVENIRAALTEADPAGAATYEANARAYVAQLEELDRWIQAQVAQIPAANRKLVTNHESFGYFAERYGFELVGTVVSSTTTGASPSARQVADLVQAIKATGAKAIFLETGTNPQLAQQVAREAGVQVVTQLYSHSLTGPNGPAPTYIEMMRYNTRAIVEALK